MAKNRTVIRVIIAGDQHGDWFGHENDRHNVGELLQCLEHANPNTIKLHPVTGDEQERHVFDIYSPNLGGESEKTWAKMESERMQSFGYNAVPAPEWKE